MAQGIDEDFNLFAEEDMLFAEEVPQAAQGVNKVERDEEVDSILNFDLGVPKNIEKPVKEMLAEIGQILSQQVEVKRVLRTLSSAIAKERAPPSINAQIRIRLSLEVGVRIRERSYELTRLSAMQLTREAKTMFEEADENLRVEANRMKRDHLEQLEKREVDRKEFIKALSKLQTATALKLRARPSLSPERRSTGGAGRIN